MRSARLPAMGFTPTYNEETTSSWRPSGSWNTRPGKSPDPDAIADLAGLSREKVHVLVHELANRKVLRVLQTPFDVRVDVLDPKPLEDLPMEDTGPGVSEELAEFAERSKEKKREMERMLRGGEAEKRRKERVAKLEEHFKSFKPKKGARESLREFGYRRARRRFRRRGRGVRGLILEASVRRGP
ncbi:MAG: hypothetical protein R3E97_21600 [Candidatus Eisenbacteria bacterium]